ncbi:MAG: hypothetical protein ABI867_44955, partial [Kofleriaceae bacterium]
VMDFDDMPDSYFAFLSNQKKLAEPDKINGALRDLGGRGGDPDPGQGHNKKVRSRASQPNLSSGSKPSVPSLPSIQRTSTQPASGGFIASHASGSKPPSRPMMPMKPGSRPPGAMQSGPHQMAGNSFGFGQAGSMANPVAAPARSNALVVVLIAVLLAAIGVLAYLVLTK